MGREQIEITSMDSEGAFKEYLPASISIEDISTKLGLSMSEASYALFQLSSSFSERRIKPKQMTEKEFMNKYSEKLTLVQRLKALYRTKL